MGNTNAGEAFEVARAGQVVWRFLNFMPKDGKQRSGMRIYRYPAEYVEALLDAF